MSDATLSRDRKARFEAETELRAAGERYDAARQAADALVRVAAEALPLLGERCPVCEQPIDAAHVQAHLRALLSTDGTDLSNLRAERDNAERALRQAQAAEERARAAVAGLRAREQRAREARELWDRWLERLQEAVRQHEDVFVLRQAGAIRQGDTQATEASVVALRELWDATSRFRAAVSADPAISVLAGLEADLAAREAQLLAARERASRASAAEEESKTLQRAAVRAATAVTTNRFEALRPVIQDVYSRLDPHPAFTRLLFSVDVYREKGIASAQVEDPEEQVSADPLLVFSSAQANVVALSAFLALGWAAREDAMPFLLLDDPLQSLDDVNALGFADLCRHIRGRRQLIVSTHDERLAALLERKLAPRRLGDRTWMLRFAAWSRSGPLVDSALVPPQMEPSVTRALLPSAA